MVSKKINEQRKKPNLGYLLVVISALIFFTSTLLMAAGILGDVAFYFVLMFGMLPSCPGIFFGSYLGARHRKKNKEIQKFEKFNAKYKCNFTDESEEEFICMICKLEICSGDIIYICPTCKAHYHEEHLLDWLKIETNCPVCEYKFL